MLEQVSCVFQVKPSGLQICSVTLSAHLSCPAVHAASHLPDAGLQAWPLPQAVGVFQAVPSALHISDAVVPEH